MANDAKKLSPRAPVLPSLGMSYGPRDIDAWAARLVNTLRDHFAELHVTLTSPQFEQVTSEGDIENTVGGPRWIVGSADPSAGAGLAAPIGSLYSRTSGGAGITLYVKEGAADTAWVGK